MLRRSEKYCSTAVVSFVVAAGIDLFYAVAERDRIPGGKPDHRSERYLPGRRCFSSRLHPVVALARDRIPLQQLASLASPLGPVLGPKRRRSGLPHSPAAPQDSVGLTGVGPWR